MLKTPTTLARARYNDGALFSLRSKIKQLTGVRCKPWGSLETILCKSLHTAASSESRLGLGLGECSLRASSAGHWNASVNGAHCDYVRGILICLYYTESDEVPSACSASIKNRPSLLPNVKWAMTHRPYFPT